MTCRIRRLGRVASIAVMVAMQACADTPTVPEQPPPVSPTADDVVIEALTPTTMTGMVGEFAPENPAIRVVDAVDGKPRAGVPVQFVIFGGGSLEQTHDTTDAAGVAASGRWQFGTRPGPVHVGVGLYGSTRLTAFQVTAHLSLGPPARLVPLSNVDQAALAGTTIDELRLAVEDRFTNRIPGVEVSFAVADGAGTLASRTTVSGIDGIAVARSWRVDTAPGKNRVTATAAGNALDFRVESLDSAALIWYRLEALTTLNYRAEPAALDMEARFAFTRFDSCLCVQQQGYYVESVRVGEYHATGGGAYSLAASELMKPRLWDLMSGRIAGDLLVLERLDEQGEFPRTWIYRRMGSGQ